MNSLAVIMKYLKNNKELVTIEQIKHLFDWNNTNSKEMREIYRAIINHNQNILYERKEERKRALKATTYITFKGYAEDEVVSKNNVPKKEPDISKYLELIKKELTQEQFEQILEEIYTSNNNSFIISELLLYLNNEKASILKLKYEANDPEDAIFLEEEINKIDEKISRIQTYNLDISEEKNNIPEINNIALLRLPSGNVALLKDIENIKSIFYNETSYYQDLLILLESIRNGNFNDVKKLQGIDSYEDRKWQFRLSFSYYKGMIVLTSLFVKKSNRDAGVYSTLKARLKIFNNIKDKIVPTDEDLEILDSIIKDLKDSLNKRGEVK